MGLETGGQGDIYPIFSFPHFFQKTNGPLVPSCQPCSPQPIRRASPPNAHVCPLVDNRLLDADHHWMDRGNGVSPPPAGYLSKRVQWFSYADAGQSTDGACPCEG